LRWRACGPQESLGYAKLAVKPSTLNIPPPSLNAMSLGLGFAPAATPPSPSSAASGFPGGGITFKLLTKKAGGKQTVKELQVPENSTFALSTRRKEEQYQEERSELKRLVLVRCPLSPLRLLYCVGTAGALWGIPKSASCVACDALAAEPPHLSSTSHLSAAVIKQPKLWF
jgi:hypothetical protein